MATYTHSIWSAGLSGSMAMQIALRMSVGVWAMGAVSVKRAEIDVSWYEHMVSRISLEEYDQKPSISWTWDILSYVIQLDYSPYIRSMRKYRVVSRPAAEIWA